MKLVEAKDFVEKYCKEKQTIVEAYNKKFIKKHNFYHRERFYFISTFAPVALIGATGLTLLMLALGTSSFWPAFMISVPTLTAVLGTFAFVVPALKNKYQLSNQKAEVEKEISKVYNKAIKIIEKNRETYKDKEPKQKNKYKTLKIKINSLLLPNKKCTQENEFERESEPIKDVQDIKIEQDKEMGL